MEKSQALYYSGAILLVLFLACSNRNAEIEKVMRSNMELMDSYIRALQAAETPQEFAQAVREYALNVRAFSPEKARLRAKYPNLVYAQETDKQLKAINEDYQDLVRKLNIVSSRMAGYNDHPDVKAAKEDLIQAWIETQ